VFNFAVLEYNVVWIIERRLKPGYLQEYASPGKTAGMVAQDLARWAKGSAEEAQLIALHSTFVGLKDLRNQLLHGNPAAAPSGEPQLWHFEIGLWDFERVQQAARDFEDAALRANSLLHGPSIRASGT